MGRNKSRGTEKSRSETQVYLGGIPRGLPGLLRAYRMGRRVATVGFDWDQPSGIINKVEEELQELKDAIAEGD